MTVNKLAVLVIGTLECLDPVLVEGQNSYFS